MTYISAVLVRTRTKHLYVGNPKGAREVYLKVDTDNDELAKELAQEYLDLRNEAAETFAVSGHVLADQQIPGNGYQIGDLMESNRVVGVGITLDQAQEGLAQITPELNDPLDERLAAFQRRLNRLSAGIAAEWAAPTINKQKQGEGTDTAPPPFSLGQELYPSTSPLWTAARPFWCAHLEVTIETPGLTDTHVELWLGPYKAATCVVPAGSQRKVRRVQHGWKRGDVMYMRITVAGRESANLTATPRGSMV